jgi:hypothetical protein
MQTLKRASRAETQRTDSYRSYDSVPRSVIRHTEESLYNLLAPDVEREFRPLRTRPGAQRAFLTGAPTPNKPRDRARCNEPVSRTSDTAARRSSLALRRRAKRGGGGATTLHGRCRFAHRSSRRLPSPTKDSRRIERSRISGAAPTRSRGRQRIQCCTANPRPSRR